MKVLVTGVKGQLGSLVVAHAPSDWDVTGVDQEELDLTRTNQIAAFVRSCEPHVVINCAAYTNVDAAESDEHTCWLVNADAAGAVAEGAAGAGARMIQVSTDYVFDGAATVPYPETAPISGLGVYGRSKAAGEIAVRQACDDATIVRTAWLYAPGPANFVATMLRLAGGGQTLRVVDDQVGQPTYADDLAQRLIEVVRADVPAGIYHGTNSGQTSWFGFAEEILRLWGYGNQIEAVSSDEFTRPAPRPGYSVLGHDAWSDVGLAPMRDWREALASAHRDHAGEFLVGRS